MNKTLLKKFTEKHSESQLPIEPDGRNILHTDMSLLQEVAQDLLQPRPQAIANILRLAREI